MTDKTEACTWAEEDPDSEVWESSCGKSFYFIDGGMDWKFCPHCGKPAIIKYREDEYPENEQTDML